MNVPDLVCWASFNGNCRYVPSFVSCKLLNTGRKLKCVAHGSNKTLMRQNRVFESTVPNPPTSKFTTATPALQ
jgi:hypothetical protein